MFFGGSSISTFHSFFFNTFLQQTEWADEVKAWETCSLNKTACPDVYVSQFISTL
ncbi:putative nuclease S(1) [Rosa chinensis]|uniref:Putative nuclease S(1) n=1 Tax=Rosa chinensis TaxID=74649 RepID=A0A2P6R1N1_ROSCH|nr:putative nuclease S(1) [Rosa chinensis]